MIRLFSIYNVDSRIKSFFNDLIKATAEVW